MPFTEILYNDKVAEALGPDATLHGLIDANQFYWHLGNLIVHSLLILGLWKEFGDRRKS
jgi:hypothetical protein